MNRRFAAGLNPVEQMNGNDLMKTILNFVMKDTRNIKQQYRKGYSVWPKIFSLFLTLFATLFF